MGCSQSKIENEEAVSRCKERKHYMKSAVAARNAFAAAHSAYGMCLKNAGAALSDFAQGETANPYSLSTVPTAAVGGGATALPSQQPVPELPPPPPPVPDMPAGPLQRAASMPTIPLTKRGSVVEATIEEEDDEGAEEEEEEEEEEEDEARLRRTRRHHKANSVSEAPPPPPAPAPAPAPEQKPAPPPPAPAGNIPTYVEYLFDTENMPNGTLEDVDEVRRDREEIARKLYEEIPKRPSAAPVAKSGAKSPAQGGGTEEKTVAEKPTLPSTPQQGGGSGSGRSVKKGKQGSGNSHGGEMKRRYLNLFQLFNELDDYFLEASESAHEISKMLEATRLHYHSNFADNRGHIDHSARVMRVITWNRSFKGFQNTEEYKDDFDSEENETLATVLDKLLAWEKKLYDEVKTGEIMKFEYHRKLALLNKQKKRGASDETLEKIKAAVSHLHTRYIVDMQAMDATVAEINRLRDEQLYPKLVALVDAMATMWDAMQLCHENQVNIALALKVVDISQSVKETTHHHHERTIQLWGVVQEWNTQFDKMINYKKEYIRALNSWLKLNLIPVDTNLKERVSSPPTTQNPLIKSLLISWQDHLEKLPTEQTKGAIHNFGAVLHTIVEQQEDELKLRAKVEDSLRDFEKKERQFHKWLKEYSKKMGEDEMDGNGVPKDEAVVQREFVVEDAKRKLDEDKENYRKLGDLVRQKTLTNLKTRLPELFRSLAEFARASSDMYGNLRAISRTPGNHSHNHKQNVA